VARAVLLRLDTMPTTPPDLFSVLAALAPEELAIVTGGAGEGLMGALRFGVLGMSLLAPDSGLSAPSLPSQTNPIVQSIGVAQR